MSTKATLYMLIGLPGSGKSTWIANNNVASIAAILSTDALIEQYAAEQGTTYDDVFADYINTALNKMNSTKKWAIANQMHVVWDQTNLTKASRKRKLRDFEDYSKVAVVFQAPEWLLEARRASRPGKTIPEYVLEGMKLELPSTDEGFDEIIYMTST